MASFADLAAKPQEARGGPVPPVKGGGFLPCKPPWEEHQEHGEYKSQQQQQQQQHQQYLQQNLSSMELNGQVVLKILQHCTEALPQMVTGQLYASKAHKHACPSPCLGDPNMLAHFHPLNAAAGPGCGTDAGGHGLLCFPSKSRLHTHICTALQACKAVHAQKQTSVAAEDGDEENAGATYQLDMMRCLREVNVDNNTVGWWVQALQFGCFLTTVADSGGPWTLHN
eukprot:1143089-Pelagomonas_calceolata.AAC.3